ncbi:hypothetical protein PAPB9_01614 [Pseudomonas aeruginosa]|nr:hypothetical protein PAPB9_01614 [Pseudomonas aeruginosa]
MTVDRIGERLRRYRRAAKKTLHQVASESGLTASFLSQAERNLTGVSISSLANIAKSLNIPLNALFDQPAQPQASGYATPSRASRWPTNACPAPSPAT